MIIVGRSVYIYRKKNKILVANYISLPYIKYLRDRLISNTIGDITWAREKPAN